DALACLPRWGRATLLLEQHNGQLDLTLLRQFLADHGGSSRPSVPLPGEENPEQGSPASLGRHSSPASNGEHTVGSFLAELSCRHHPPLLWWAFGPPCLSVYLPLTFEGALPRALQTSGEVGGESRLGLLFARLQREFPDRRWLRQALA